MSARDEILLRIRQEVEQSEKEKEAKLSKEAEDFCLALMNVRDDLVDVVLACRNTLPGTKGASFTFPGKAGVYSVRSLSQKAYERVKGNIALFVDFCKEQQIECKVAMHDHGGEVSVRFDMTY